MRAALLVPLALLVLLLALPAAGASCHYCLHGPDPVQEAWHWVLDLLP